MGKLHESKKIMNNLFPLWSLAVKDKQTDTSTFHFKGILHCRTLSSLLREEAEETARSTVLLSFLKNHGSLARSPGPVWRAEIFLLSGESHSSLDLSSIHTTHSLSLSVIWIKYLSVTKIDSFSLLVCLKCDFQSFRNAYPDKYLRKLDAHLSVG